VGSQNNEKMFLSSCQGGGLTGTSTQCLATVENQQSDPTVLHFTQLSFNIHLSGIFKLFAGIAQNEI